MTTVPNIRSIRHRPRLILGLAACSAVPSLLLVVPSAAQATPPSCIDFQSSGATGSMECQVPAGTTKLRVVAEGAGGGGAGGTGATGANGAGGSGARVTHDITVNPGDILTLEVGTGGGATTNVDGAGGGGWTAVKSGATILLVAAGGGGAGSADSSYASGAVVSGGDASQGGSAAGAKGSSNNTDLDGGAGATTGAVGAGGVCVNGCGNQTMYNGTSGSQGAGGTGAEIIQGEAKSGKGGSGWQGGAAGNQGLFGTGGGGGSGYYGGGGGSARWFALGAGGGAGSSYPATGATYAKANNGGAVNTAGGKGSISITAAPLPAPEVTNVSPRSGSTSGGAQVTITGTGFVSGATVTIGGQAATNVTVVSATQITATTPAGGAGVKDIVVTNPDTQSGTGVGLYTYDAPTTTTTVSPSSPLGPVVPNSGLAPGSSLVTVDGNRIPVTITRASSAITMTGSGFTMNLIGLDENKATGRLDDQGRLVLQAGGYTRVSGEGFAPDSDVEVYLFSTPVLLGTARTDATGAFTKMLAIPADTRAGDHTIQANGYTTDGKVRSLNLGVVVPSSVATSGTLPETGAGTSVPAVIALASMLIGAMLLAVRRRIAA